MLLQPRKQYIALNSETYIGLKQQELRTCKRIGYEFIAKNFLPLNTKPAIVVKVLSTLI